MNQRKNAFNDFDDLKAALRLITTLLEEESTDMNRSALIKQMNTQDVPHNQVYITIKALTALGLIEETQTKRGNKRSTHTHLTPKGRQIAQLAVKIKQTLT